MVAPDSFFLPSELSRGGLFSGVKESPGLLLLPFFWAGGACDSCGLEVPGFHIFDMLLVGKYTAKANCLKQTEFRLESDLEDATAQHPMPLLDMDGVSATQRRWRLAMFPPF